MLPALRHRRRAGARVPRRRRAVQGARAAHRRGHRRSCGAAGPRTRSTFAGEFWRLERITVLPAPVQQPLPVWIGGNSEAAMRRAGRLGDGWIPSFITPEQFRVGVEKTQAFAAEAGREVPADHFGVLFYFCLDPDPAAARGDGRALHSARPRRRRRRWPGAPPSARPRSFASGWRSTSPAAARSSSSARCARPSRCSSSSAGSPRTSFPTFIGAERSAAARSAGAALSSSAGCRSAAAGSMLPPGEDHADARLCGSGSRPDSTAAARRRRSARHDLRAEGQVAHGGPDLVVAHQQNIGEVGVQDGERQRPRRREPDAVGDRRRRRDRTRSPLRSDR